MRRALGGKLAISMLTVFIDKYESPLRIGDFIENYESQTLEKDEHMDREQLQSLLKDHFQNVEERQVFPMRPFLACKVEAARA